MKTIGLIDGMSWESTAIHYRRINQAAKARRGTRFTMEQSFYVGTAARGAGRGLRALA